MISAFLINISYLRPILYSICTKRVIVKHDHLIIINSNKTGITTSKRNGGSICLKYFNVNTLESFNLKLVSSISLFALAKKNLKC